MEFLEPKGVKEWCKIKAEAFWDVLGSFRAEK
jgi:hypothetical protein